MIVGISGRLGSGKDTVGKIIQYLVDSNKFNYKISKQEYARYLINHHNSKCDWEIKKFADKLKDMVCLLIGCTREQLEDAGFKEKELGEEWWYYRNSKNNKLYDYKTYDGNVRKLELLLPTPRMLLQSIGTDLFRDQLHPQIWVNALMSEYKPISDIQVSNTFDDNRLSHGLNKTKIFRIYHNIKQRCNNQSHPRYNDYGGRGIKLLEDWENSFDSFKNWAIEKGFNETLTIDRKDNDLGYSKENCRIVSYSTQAINTSIRKDNTSGYRGVNFNKGKFRATISINKEVKTLGYFDTAEEASEVYELAFIEREQLYEEQEESNIKYPSWIITDLRFPNELGAVKSRNGITIRVNSNSADVKVGFRFILKEDSTEKCMISEHSSETSLDTATFDYIIDNNGSIEELIEKVKEILVKENILKK